jgi:hypothetical protein
LHINFFLFFIELYDLFKNSSYFTKQFIKHYIKLFKKKN